MFDWRKRVQILRAESALRDGRIDEALAIASDKELGEWRDCQVILEKLVDPFLDRAEHHFGERRLQDALADVERAQAAGGNRPRVAELRAKVVEEIEARRRRDAKERDLLASARRHLAQGSLGAGKALLEEVATSAETEVRKLKREADRREEAARDACARSELLLNEGALLEAMRAGREALLAFPRLEGLAALLLRLKAAAVPAILQALEEGSLAIAGELQAALLAVCGESLETRRAGEAIEACRQAAARLSRGEYQGAQADLLRLEKLLPAASWVGPARTALKGISEGLETLRAGPLSPLAPAKLNGLAAGAVTLAAPAARPADRREPARGWPERFLLWVDGVGSYLVLKGDRISLGRAGSSSRPDVALSADIAGVQAEVLRVDEDYFLAAHGPVEVNGRRVDRKLLADGDRIALGARCELVFRLPSSLSTTAVLELGSGQRVEGDVRQIILLDRHLLLGRGENVHLRAAAAAGQVLLSAGERGLVVRAEEGVTVDGRPEGQEAVAQAGAQVKIGDLTFTFGTVKAERS